MDFDIRLIRPGEMETIIPLLRRLNGKIPTEVLQFRLQEMVLQGYQCVGVYDQKRLIGISGIWLLTKYYVGRHIEPDNVYILPEYQGNGLGQKLMEWIFDYARAKGCSASELNCYAGNRAGQRFWEQ